jgi:hypothetical protein
MKNPLDGVFPDFTVFGTQFTTIYMKLAAGVWAIGIIAAVYYLGHGIVGMNQNKAGHPGQLREAKKEAVVAGWSLGLLISLASIVTIFMTIFQA